MIRAHVLDGAPNVRSLGCVCQYTCKEIGKTVRAYRFAWDDEKTKHQSCKLRKPGSENKKASNGKRDQEVIHNLVVQSLRCTCSLIHVSLVKPTKVIQLEGHDAVCTP